MARVRAAGCRAAAPHDRRSATATRRTGGGSRSTSTRCSRCARRSSAAGCSCSTTSGRPSTPCGNCDTCLSPPESWDGTVPGAEAALDRRAAAAREHQRFGAGHLIDILLGRDTERIRQHGHDELTTFGIGTELSEQEWRGVVRQLLAQGLLAVNSDGYGTLVITEASAEVLSGGAHRDAAPRARAHRRARRSARPAAAPSCRSRRSRCSRRCGRGAPSVAREQGVPAYIVFGDATLRGIALTRPASLAELGTITGVGEKKLESYGEGVLAVVRRGQSPVRSRGSRPVTVRLVVIVLVVVIAAAVIALVAGGGFSIGCDRATRASGS